METLLQSSPLCCRRQLRENFKLKI